MHFLAIMHTESLATGQNKIGEVSNPVFSLGSSAFRARLESRGRCYALNFLRFLPISGEKNGVFRKSQFYGLNVWKN
jgi:hypothetical protein